MTDLPEPPPVDASAFRTLMSRWATGVSVVTAHAAGHDAGLTVNALLSVSLAPPALLVSLSNDVDTLPLIERAGRFGVTFLSAEQRSLSERFAQTLPSDEKFRGVAVHRGPGGSALLDGGLAALECRLLSRTPMFDHTLVVGEVVHTEVGIERTPLLFYRSGYAESDGSDRLRLAPRRP
ncbi:MAG TPA: flavin reductase family protein [Thermoplasmata archaeon]|nr:flavin reductase family protein [Thermoplasmata archaeon]